MRKFWQPKSGLWLVLVGALVVFAIPATHATGLVPVTLYNPDPQHLWNRLYSVLLTGNEDIDSTVTDLLDPPLWGSTFLSTGPSHSAALALLEEFVTSGPRPDTMSPMQRAVMQRDLLGVFHWFEGFRSDMWRPENRELLVALALAIRHVALTPEEIAKLPDNYAAAVAAPGAVTDDNPAQPAAFLPKDLLAEDGPWIGLLQESGQTATAHFRTFKGRSSFEVRMRHPEGRKAGKAYLDTLALMPNPLVYDPGTFSTAGIGRMERGAHMIGKRSREAGQRISPETPQFPTGTMWALVRRAILAAPDGEPVASPLVESVQIRIFRSTESGRTVMESPEVKARLAVVEKSRHSEASMALYSEKVQTAFEWETRHSLLLHGAGLHLTQPEDLRFAVFPNGMQTAKMTAQCGPQTAPVAGLCSGCHSDAGIHSILSRSRTIMTDPQLARPPEFFAVTRAELNSSATRAAEAQPGWVLLKWLMTEPRER